MAKVSLYYRHGYTTPEQIVNRFKDVAPVIEVTIEMFAIMMTMDMQDSEGIIEWDSETNAFSVRETDDGI